MLFFLEEFTHEFEHGWDHIGNLSELDGFNDLPDYRRK
jgi:hypothetical protein